MSNDKETPEKRRERIRQEEWKSNPGGNLNPSIEELAEIWLI